ncbi:MAG TPA: dienelactone hydrolase family protein [Ancylobacter sp.]
MKFLVIFLHGVGSRGTDLEVLGNLWRAKLSDASFAAPDAPFAFDQGGPGRQWFSVRGVTEASRPQRVLDAREAFDQTVAKLVEANGLSSHLERVALVGFSQGSIMALDAVASGRWPVAAVVAFAGRLASPEPLAPFIGTRVLLVHGGADPVIPALESVTAQTRLERAGVEVERHILPGLGHTISQDGASIARDYLAGIFEQA